MWPCHATCGGSGTGMWFKGPSVTHGWHHSCTLPNTTQYADSMPRRDRGAPLFETARKRQRQEHHHRAHPHMRVSVGLASSRGNSQYPLMCYHQGVRLAAPNSGPRTCLLDKKRLHTHDEEATTNIHNRSIRLQRCEHCRNKEQGRRTIVGRTMRGFR